MKKGVLFTLSILLIVSLVLAIAILNFKSVQKTKDVLSEVGAVERVYNLGTSVANGFKEIFNAYSGINLTLVNETITFKEFLPNTNTALFKNSLDNYKVYVENEDNNTKLNINTLKNELPLLILPHNITYTHSSFGDKRIIVDPNKINFDKYYVKIENFITTSCNWNTYPGTFQFQLETDNPTCNNIQNIDITQNNLININNGIILIYINKTLIIENNGASAYITTSINLNKTNHDRITIESKPDIINLNYSDLGVSRTSGFRII